MNIQLLVTAELTFTSGKFASKDDVIEALKDEISDPGSLTVNEGEYNVDSFEVEEHAQPSAVAVRAEQKWAARRLVLVSQTVDLLNSLQPGSGRSETTRQLVKALREAFKLPGPDSAPGG